MKSADDLQRKFNLRYKKKKTGWQRLKGYGFIEDEVLNNIKKERKRLKTKFNLS